MHLHVLVDHHTGSLELPWWTRASYDKWYHVYHRSAVECCKDRLDVHCRLIERAKIKRIGRAQSPSEFDQSLRSQESVR